MELINEGRNPYSIAKVVGMAYQRQIYHIDAQLKRKLKKHKSLTEAVEHD